MNNKLTLIISFVLSLLLITIGLSFAYFTANITGTENTTTIEASGGVMNINYDGGENINTPNIFPSNDAFATKNFTLTGKSTTNDNMNYHIILVIEENTFTNNALQYKLTSTNTDGNGTVAPLSVQSGIANGAHEIFLGDGTFESPANNKLHSYSLELYFPDTIKNQNDDMNKTFKAYINIRGGQYNYPGYNPEKGVNHPVLFTGMTPVKWDEDNKEIETTEDDPDWFDYDEKRWANAKSADGSYWVWIPRYAYKILTCYHTSADDCLLDTGKPAGEIDVKFLKGTTNMSEDNASIESTGYEAHIKDTSMHYFLHPAFQFNGDELGFWIAKFEPSVANQESDCYLYATDFCDNTTETLTVIPNVKPWIGISVSNAFIVSRNMKNKKEIYGWFSSELDSHMMKNVEWGAVTYLTNSRYGANKEIWNNSNINRLTGCSGNTENADSQSFCTEYDSINGVKASTTHTIYGVYDMRGGAREYVAAYVDTGDNNLIHGESLLISELKYKDIYKKSDSGTRSDNFDVNSHYYGDAIYETSDSGRSENSGWFYAYSFFPSGNVPWFRRGGGMEDYGQGYYPGIYYFYSGYGHKTQSFTFRPVLVPLK